MCMQVFSRMFSVWQEILLHVLKQGNVLRTFRQVTLIEYLINLFRTYFVNTVPCPFLHHFTFPRKKSWIWDIKIGSSNGSSPLNQWFLNQELNLSGLTGQKGICLCFREASAAFTDSSFLWLFEHGAGGASILLKDFQGWLAEQMCQYYRELSEEERNYYKRC